MKGFEFLNRKARHDYEPLESFTAGIILCGTEIKAIREGKVSFTDSFCYLRDDGLWIKNLFIPEYKLGTNNNHDPKRERKLLLTKSELKSIRKQMKNKGLTIIPFKMFELKGLAKLEISICRGLKSFDKKMKIREKDIDRDMERDLK